MTLDRSIVQIFRRLGLWSRFPKYALERRLDIFLTPFLEQFFSEHDVPGRVRLVLPEFPILSEICALHPADGKVAASLTSVSARTVNADYLLHRSGLNPAWILVELKTDVDSLGKDQLKRYRAAQLAEMRGLIEHLEKKVLPRTKKRHDARYRAVIKRLKARQRDPIEIVYLSPEVVKPLVPAKEAIARGQRDVPRCHTLGELAASGPYRHDALWKHVARLLRVLDEAARRRVRTSRRAAA